MYTGLIRILQEMKPNDISQYVLPTEKYFVKPIDANSYYVKYVSSEEELSFEALNTDLKVIIREGTDGSVLHTVTRNGMRKLFNENKIKIIT